MPDTTIDTAIEYKPFFDASPLLGDAAALRERMDQDGYLFLPGLLPSAQVARLYEEILALCREAGWTDASGRPLGEPRLEGADDWWPVYDRLQKLESFHALAHVPALTGVVEALVREPVFPHPRNIARITFPAATFFTTPAHQDFPLIQGTTETYTAWTPLCDCPEDRGGLGILDRSHRVGMLPVHSAVGPGGTRVDTDLPGCTWRGQDMGAGDVLLFHSYTVHSGRPNVSKADLRISADYRYQGVSQPVSPGSLKPHYERLTWDEITDGWKNRDLVRYWERLPLNVTETGR
jgi:hypothetical protein